MAVKVVTDSTSDLPSDLIEGLGITVVPCNVNFGTDSYKDGVDLSTDEFYERLVAGPVLPTTSQPSPGDFVEVYEEVGKDSDGIVSVHVSSKLSGTYNSAVQAKAEASADCPIEVVDSYQASMGMGVVAQAAAEAARNGESHEGVTRTARSAVGRAQLLFLLDTLEYLEKGGRIGKARAMLGSILNIKPLITLQDGIVDQAGRSRSFAKGAAKLVEIARQYAPLETACVLYTSTPDAALELVGPLKDLMAEGKAPFVSRAGTTIGTYAGPGALGIGLLQADSAAGPAG